MASRQGIHLPQTADELIEMEAAADDIKKACVDAGAFRAGIAAIHPVDEEEVRSYGKWIARGCHGTMDYLARYPEVRRDPGLLLEGARSVICCAFPYSAPPPPQPGKLRIASYALGDDYHDVIRRRLKPVVRLLREKYGAKSRITVDTAPLRERLWAREAGLGFIGKNNQLIVPGAGSRVFLAEIITTLPLAPDPPLTLSCAGCDACVRSCPGRALIPDGSRVTLDAGKCLSYLTIEYDGELTQSIHGRFYGCDACQDVCPHNSVISALPLPEFMPREEIAGLSPDGIASMNEEEYDSVFARSAIRRAPLQRLMRNLKHL